MAAKREDSTPAPVGPGVDLEIRAFLHCGMCLAELPAGHSPKDHARLGVGWTNKGFQVWCNRHDVNILNADLEGHKMIVNTFMKKTKGG